jgi:cytochrome c oxidase subunit I
MHASPPADLQQTDTYFIVAHFHYVLFGGSMFGLFAGTYFYFPKFSGRIMSEKLGNWSFWLMFIGMTTTFFPMHFSGLLGMPRRIYTYDDHQGYTNFNLASTVGTFILILGVAITLYNFFKSKKSGAISGNDPWEAGTLEWSIPSPPPEYNFAELPRVTSRYPLWDLTHPEMMGEVPHTHHGDQRMGVAAGRGVEGKEVGETHINPANSQHMVAGSRMHVETEVHTAKEIGIPMPNPTIMPLVCATGVIVMFCGLLFLEKSTMTGVGVMLFGAVWWISALYNWLTTPLEDAH